MAGEADTGAFSLLVVEGDKVRLIPSRTFTQNQVKSIFFANFRSISSQNVTFLATGPATVVDIFHSTHLPRFPEREKKDLNNFKDAVLPHASANPHHSIRGRGLCERHRPREGNKSRKYQKEFHPYAGEGTPKVRLRFVMEYF